MSTDFNDIEEHEVTKALTLLVSESERLAGDKETVPYREDIEKLRARAEYILNRLRGVDPVLLGEDQAGAILGQITEAKKRLNQFSNPPAVRYAGLNQEFRNRESQHLRDALTYVNQALAQSSNLPVQFPADAQHYRDIIVSVRRSAGVHIRNLEQEAAAIRESIEKVKAETAAVLKDLNSQKGRLDKAIAEFQAQFSKAEEGRRDTFSEDMHRWAQDFSVLIENAKDTHNEMVKGLEQTVNQIESDARAQVAEHLKVLRKFRGEAQKLVGVIGNVGTATGFQETAIAASGSARKWEWLTIGAFVLLVIFGAVMFVMTTKEGFDWHLLAARLLLIIPLGVFAGWAAHKAEQGRVIERTSRRMALELASISPYLATMPEDQQHAVKRILADRFFAQPDQLHGNNKDKASQTSTSMDLARSALDSVKAALEVITKK